MSYTLHTGWVLKSCLVLKSYLLYLPVDLTWTHVCIYMKTSGAKEDNSIFFCFLEFFCLISLIELAISYHIQEQSKLIVMI